MLDRRHVGLLLAAETLLGFCVGAWFRSWQVAIEPGQTLAGLVSYPAWNPEFRYHVGTWTLLNQLAALLLRAGLSETAVSTILSGFAGATAFAAIALIAYAVSRRPAIAFVAPLLLVYARGGPWFSGLTYTIYLFGYPWTYGMIGLSAVLLVLGLLACGEARWAGFAAAVTFAIHPALGLWLCAILAIVALLQRQWFATVVRSSWILWTIGGTITAASFIAHRAVALPVPPDPRGPAYFSAFIRYWDSHRRPFPLTSAAMAEVAAAVGLSILLLHWARRERDEGLRVLATATIAAVVLGLGFSVSYWLPPENVPPLILALMPSRLPNVAIATAFVLGITALARRGHDLTLLCVLVVVIANALLGVVPRSVVVVAVECVVLVVMLVSRSRAVVAPQRAMRLAVAATLAIVVVHLATSMAAAAWPPMQQNDFWRIVASRQGTLVTSPGVSMVQARTRRPVLLNPFSLDYLPFTPGVGPAVEAILRDVYGVDLVNPPAEIRAVRRGGLLPEHGRRLWQSRSPEQWRALRRQFGVTEVLCPEHWRIRLPRVASGDGLVLYAIP